jgi:hypothetical protein
MSQTSLTARADTIAEELQDLAVDVEDNADALTELETIIESLREINFNEENPEFDEEGALAD